MAIKNLNTTKTMHTQRNSTYPPYPLVIKAKLKPQGRSAPRADRKKRVKPQKKKRGVPLWLRFMQSDISHNKRTYHYSKRR